MEEKKPLRIGVVGGGIASLCFVISLGKLIPDLASRLIIDVYESTGTLEAQIGAGIGLYAYTWGILEYLGVDKELAQHTTSVISDGPLPFFKVRQSDRPEGRDLFTLQSEAGGVILFHRANLQSVLLRNVPPSVRIHTKKRLRTYSQNQDAVHLYFEDGTTAQCDFVVGADGLQSRVRRTMMEEYLRHDGSTSRNSSDQGINQEHYLEQLSNPYWTGGIIYRDLIPVKELIEAGWDNHRVLTGDYLNVGKDCAIMSYLVAGGTMVNFAALKWWPELEGSVYSEQTVDEQLGIETRKGNTPVNKPTESPPPSSSDADDDSPWVDNGGGGLTRSGRARWVQKVEPSEVQKVYEGWEPDMQILVDLIKAPLRWAIHAIHPLPVFRSGKVCVVGDAAHAMVPYLGQGSGQAISDGFVLAKLIACMTEDRSADPRAHLGALLDAYDTVRRPTAQKIVETSRNHGNHWFLRAEDADGQLSVVDTDNKEEVDALCQGMTDKWSICWDKRASFLEADKAVDLFKQRIASTGAH